MGDIDSEPKNVGSDRLGRSLRVFCLLIGLLALGGGAAAVYISKNTLGTATLLMIGAVFSFVGFSGIPIVRVAFGKFAIELAQIAQRALDSPNTEVQLEMATIVLDSGLPATNSVRRQAETLNAAVGYEAQVIAALVRVAGNASVQVRENDLRVDAVVRYQEKRIGVEAKFKTHAGSVGVRQAITHSRFLLAGQFGRDLDGMIVVVNQVTSQVDVEAQLHDRLRVVVWRSPNDDDELKRALHALSN